MTRDYWLDVAERLVRIFSLTMLAQFGADVFDVRQVHWDDALAVSGGATLGSLLLSLAAIKLGNKGTASLTDATVPTSYADAIAQGRAATGLRNGPHDPNLRA